MKRIVFLLVATLLTVAPIRAYNWEHITTSGDYYYGVGTGSTEEMADKAALADLASMIATNVTSGFDLVVLQKNKNGTVESQSNMENVIKTYSHSTLTNVHKDVLPGKKGQVTVRRWMLRSELDKIYEGRTELIRQMVDQAERSQDRGSLDQALQYYYWAYTMLRTLQFPHKVKDSKGKVLSAELPYRIETILKNVKVDYEKREGDCVDLLFTYKGQPVSSLEFLYNDGNEEVRGRAMDGRSTLYMADGAQPAAYHIDIDFEQKEQARGDVDLGGVLDVIPRRDFKDSHIDVRAKARKDVEQIAATTGVNLNLSTSQLVVADKAQQQADVVAQVVKAIESKQYSSAISHFTPEGLRRYNMLISYGQGRVVGTPRLKACKGMDGHTVFRGMQMSFSFKTGKKKTYTEDVAFTVDSLGLIDNVAFGLGNVAENDILCKNPTWSNDTKEMLMEFLENYKTAYCLKDIDYLEKVFSDKAIIIVGNVAKVDTRPAVGERPISLRGQEVINKNQLTKAQYLKNLRRCFARNEFINIRFTNNDIQRLDKYKEQEKYGIQIGQEYNSSTYADKGYLFLQVNMTNHREPKIEIRTWQENETDLDKIYNAGWFYDE